MTAIAGFLDWKRDVLALQDTLHRMSHVQAHRGSDGQPAIFLPHLALAHAHTSRQSHITVSLDGFLYNGDEIRRTLSSAGHRFETETDAEVFQHAYLEWGPSFLEHLIGAYAVALWDNTRQCLLLARDHLGLKPLFYSERDGAFPFASEIKALLQHPSVTAAVDAQGLTEVFAMGPLYSPGQAVFRDVREILPGQLVIVNREGLKAQTFWQLDSLPHSDSPEATIARISEMLEQNVARQLQASSPVSVILTGGLDSSGLTAIAAQLLAKQGRPLQTFSFNTMASLDHDSEDLDAPWVRRVADYLGTTNIEVLIDTPEMIEHVAMPVTAHDLPIEAELDTLHYLNLRRARQDSGVVLLGEASDELFGSLYWLHDPEFLEMQSFPWVYPQLDKILTDEMLHMLRADEYVQDAYNDVLREVPRLQGETPEQNRQREMTYIMLTRYLPFLLRRSDRLTTAAGLEARMPFCDPRFFQYAWNLPWELKNHGGHSKGVLREAFRPLLPDDVIYRKKSDAPILFNTAYSDYLNREAARLLSDTQSPLYPMLDRNKLQTKLDAGAIQTSIYWRFRMDYLIQVERWMKTYGVYVR